MIASDRIIWMAHCFVMRNRSADRCSLSSVYSLHLSSNIDTAINNFPYQGLHSPLHEQPRAAPNRANVGCTSHHGQAITSTSKRKNEPSASFRSSLYLNTIDVARWQPPFRTTQPETGGVGLYVGVHVCIHGQLKLIDVMRLRCSCVVEITFIIRSDMYSPGRGAQAKPKPCGIERHRHASVFVVHSCGSSPQSMRPKLLHYVSQLITALAHHLPTPDSPTHSPNHSPIPSPPQQH